MPSNARCLLNISFVIKERKQCLILGTLPDPDDYFSFSIDDARKNSFLEKTNEYIGYWH